MWLCMHSLFGFKKLVDQCEIENNNTINTNTNSNNNNNISSQNIYNDYDSVSILNNLDEFKSLFKMQEKMCYELRSENNILKIKLEAANKVIKSKTKKIQSLKIKKNNLEIENNVYKNVLCNSSLSFNNSICENKKYITNEQEQEEKKQQLHSIYPPPPPPPLPLPPPNKIKINESYKMNNVLDELKSKIKLIE